MGIYLLNISVDPADPNPNYIPEDLSFNDQESMVEIVLEKILGFEDAISEYDDHDTEDHNQKKRVKIDLVVHFHDAKHRLHDRVEERKTSYPNHEAQLITGFKEIKSPPPKR